MIVALVQPAVAEPVDPVGETYAGLTCGFNGTNDPSGEVIQDPNTHTGEVDGGPWAVPGASSVTMTCTISVGDGVVSPDDAAVSQTTAGSVGVLAAPIQYQAGPGVSVWLCTNVSWTYDEVSGVVTSGGGSWEGDLEDVDGNPHCDETISLEVDLGNECALTVRVGDGVCDAGSRVIAVGSSTSAVTVSYSGRVIRWQCDHDGRATVTYVTARSGGSFEVLCI